MEKSRHSLTVINGGKNETQNHAYQPAKAGKNRVVVPIRKHRSTEEILEIREAMRRHPSSI